MIMIIALLLALIRLSGLQALVEAPLCNSFLKQN